MELRMRSGYSLGVAGAVVDEGRVLLVRRLHEPNSGRLTFPSGYVGPEESVEQAIVREITEETGVEAEVVGVLGVRNRVSPNDNNLLLFFLLRHVGGLPAPDGVEVSEARFYTFEEAEDCPDFIELNRQVVRKIWKNADACSFGPVECPPTPGLLALRYVAFI